MKGNRKRKRKPNVTFYIRHYPYADNLKSIYLNKLLAVNSSSVFSARLTTVKNIFLCL